MTQSIAFANLILIYIRSHRNQVERLRRTSIQPDHCPLSPAPPPHSRLRNECRYDAFSQAKENLVEAIKKDPFVTAESNLVRPEALCTDSPDEEEQKVRHFF